MQRTECAAADRYRIALTMGDPNGIGPEVLLECLTRTDLPDHIDPIIIALERVLTSVAERLDLAVSANSLNVHGLEDISAYDYSPGVVDRHAGTLSMRAVQRAAELCLAGDVDAMVTCPISKEAIAAAGYEVPGHTEFIGELVSASLGAPAGRDAASKTKIRPTMMMIADFGAETLRVGLVTGHLPLSDVASRITVEAIYEKLGVMARSLRGDFGISEPTIAVLGLNPHAGDGGVLGPEEQQIIRPAIQAARAQGLDVTGPHPADGFFGRREDRSVDAVLAMYHDQGLVPFKTLSFERGTNFTAGLPIVRTSPDHGTAFDIAGRGEASAASLYAAINVAAGICRHRSTSTE